jgi:hypothetical protein
MKAKKLASWKNFNLDKVVNGVFYSVMFSREDLRATARGGVRAGAIALAVCLSMSAVGCVPSSLPKQVTALSNATAPVVEQATTAYRDAETAYELGSDYDAITEFDAAQPVYNPRTVKVLLSDKDIQDRLAVLAALQLYVKDLAAITKGTDSPALDAASASIGSNLSSIGNTLAPSIEGVLGITLESDSTTQTTISTTSGTTTTSSTTTAPTPAPLVSTGVQNGISVGLDALGQFLVARTIQKDLPQKIEAMDPNVEQLCKLLSSDVGILQDMEHRGYDKIINQQTLFLRENANKIDPDLRRAEIMKLPQLARQQQAADEKLTDLKAALVKLALTHHALAAAAQGNNPESLTQKLGDLEAAGESLGAFYSSLPSQ